MKVGMTGTRDGMTLAQKDALIRALKKFTPKWFHHGDCLGADADGHDIADICGTKICIHPPSKRNLRAFKYGNAMREEKGYLQRNRDIVNDTDVLIGFPKEMISDPYDGKGGTWYTIKYGIGKGKVVYIVFPDGSISAYNT